MNSPSRIASPIEILPSTIIQIRRLSIDQQTIALERAIMRQRGVGTRSGYILVREPAVVFGATTELGEAPGGFPFGHLLIRLRMVEVDVEVDDALGRL